MEQPTSANEIQSFLGMATFSCHFIKNYTNVTAPLRAKPHLRYEESAKETELFIDAVVQSQLPDALTMTALENVAKRVPEMMGLKN